MKLSLLLFVFLYAANALYADVEAGIKALNEGNHQKAYQEFAAAAKEGNAAAHNNLGVLTLQGKGVKQDNAKAIEHFRAAASLGYLDAQTALGIMYYKGELLDRNMDAALGYLGNAAKFGNLGAMTHLGHLYWKGKHVKQDYAKALNYYRLAAERGDHAAANDYGLMLMEGHGTDVNMIDAYAWIVYAESGLHKGKRNIGIITEKMGDDLEAGKQREKKFAP